MNFRSRVQRISKAIAESCETKRLSELLGSLECWREFYGSLRPRECKTAKTKTKFHTLHDTVWEKIKKVPPSGHLTRSKWQSDSPSPRHAMTLYYLLKQTSIKTVERGGKMLSSHKHGSNKKGRFKSLMYERVAWEESRRRWIRRWLRIMKKHFIY